MIATSQIVEERETLSPKFLLKEAGWAHASLQRMKQVHGVDLQHLRGLEEPPPTCDGLIAPLGGAKASSPLVLCVAHADCQAALFFDRRTKRIAALHVGWRGQVAGIYTRMVQELKKLGGAHEDLFVWISPSLGPCCAHIPHPPDNFLPRHFLHRDDQSRFDLWAMAREELLSLGLVPEQVFISEICTKCDQRFYSYRRGDKSERNYSFITLNHSL